MQAIVVYPITSLILSILMPVDSFVSYSLTCKPCKREENYGQTAFMTIVSYILT